MVEIRKKMHREIIQKMRDKYSGILESTIPYASIVEQMGIYRAPVTRYRANSAAGEAYKELWQEIQQKFISI